MLSVASPLGPESALCRRPGAACLCLLRRTRPDPPYAHADGLVCTWACLLATTVYSASRQPGNLSQELCPFRFVPHPLFDQLLLQATNSLIMCTIATSMGCAQGFELVV